MHLDDIEVVRPTIEYDERLQVLSRAAAMQLPAPLRTLLAALAELKEDMVRDKIRQIMNHESIVISDLMSRVDYSCSALRTCTESIRDALEHGVKAFKDTALQQAVWTATGSDTPVTSWHEALQKRLLTLETKLHEELRLQTESQPSSVGPSLDGAQKALDAVAESVRVRQRLIALSVGPLSEFFEPQASTEKPSSEVEVVQPQRERPPQGTLVEDIRLTKVLMRRVRAALDGIRRDQDVAIDDALSLCARSIQKLRPSKTTLQIVANPTMVQADLALQKEIAFMLNTLSADTSALDLVLRAIRAKCNGIEEIAAVESTGSWAIRLGAWKLQLCEAHAALIKARL